MDFLEDGSLDAEMDDWIDEALKRGEGFKTEEERQEYIKSLGDPFKHPMFAQSPEDMEGHPLLDAFRSLREEDKVLYSTVRLYVFV